MGDLRGVLMGIRRWEPEGEIGTPLNPPFLRSAGAVYNRWVSVNSGKGMHHA